MPIETWPLAVSTCSSRTLNAMPACLCGGLRAIQLRRGSNEDADLVRQHACLCAFGNPVANRLDFLVLAPERLNCRRRTVENGNRIAAVLAVAIHVGHDGAEQAIRLRADLVRGAIVDAQSARAAANIDAERLPRERLLEDALAEVAGKEQRIGTAAAQRGQEPQVGDADILRLVHDREVEDDAS